MRSISSLATVGMKGVKPDAGAENPAIKNLFLLLQGSYGSLFLTKYATGVLDDSGRDLGVRAAMSVWRAQLGKYPDAVIERAAFAVTKEHPKFPPNLPEFEAICRAMQPRKTYAQENNLPALPPPVTAPRPVVEFDAQGDDKDWARKIVAEDRAGIKRTPFIVQAAMTALGLSKRRGVVA